MKRGKSISSSSSERDRISDLPDSLIHHILSFMETNHAVRTCVLSKRWRYIWTSMPILNFTDCYGYIWESYDEDTDDDGVNETKRFIKFVNKVLSLRNTSDIQRFCLECSLYYTTASPLYKCIYKGIAAAVKRNVQEVRIDANPDDNFDIPLCLCTCKSLKKLELNLSSISDDEYKSEIILPCKMSLPRLKSLHLRLEGLSFNDEKLTNKFFSSFPTLETLIIDFSGNCGFHNMNLKISLPELKHFQFESSEDELSNSEVTLHATSLSSFIFNSYMSTSFKLENLSSLITADITIHLNREDEVPENSDILAEKKEFYAQRTRGLLRGVHTVEVLTLNGSFIKALGGAPAILDAQPPKLYKLKHLELKTYLSRDCLCSIFYILKNSPNIESVSLKTQLNYNKPPLYPYCDKVEFNPENIGDYWDVGLSFSCMLCHLKLIKIKYLCGSVNELKFLEILLKHATVLEKVVLTGYSTEQDSQWKRRMTKFSEMLLTFPTISKKVLILLKF